MDAQTKEAAESLDILGRIAGDAYDKTGGDVFGTEPPPVESQPPAEQAEVPAEPTEPTSEGTTPEPAPLIYGKYKTTEEAERGYFEAARMGNEAKARADAAEAALAAARQVIAPGPTPASDDPLDAIENYGVPKELIKQGMQQVAKQTIKDYFAPALAITAADKAIIEAHPEYAEKFSEIEAHAQSDPTVWGQIEELNSKGNYLAARQIAYLNWKVASTAHAVAVETHAKAERTTEAKNARVDAGVGGSRRSDTRTAQVAPETSAADEKRLLDLYKAGHPQPYLRSKLDSVLGPDFDKATALLG